MADELDTLLIKAQHDPCVSHLTSLLATFCGRSAIYSLIDKTLELAPDDIQVLAADSYWHSNGFKKLVLRGFNQGPRLRVHHWPSKTFMQPFHSHSWSFASTVVCGSLMIEQASVQLGGGQASVFRIPNKKAMQSGKQIRMESSNASLSVDSRMELMAGGSHAITFGEYHAVRCSSPKGAVSLVLQGPHETWFSQFVATSSIALRNPYAVDHLTVGNYVESLTALRKQLDELHISA